MLGENICIFEKRGTSEQGGEVVEEQVSFPIYHINIVSGCFIIISMSTRGWLKIFVVQEKGEQGSGEEDWLLASGGVRLVDNSGSTWNLIR